jgi:hypothetical protein
MSNSLTYSAATDWHWGRTAHARSLNRIVGKCCRAMNESLIDPRHVSTPKMSAGWMLPVVVLAKIQSKRRSISG